MHSVAVLFVAKLLQVLGCFGCSVALGAVFSSNLLYTVFALNAVLGAVFGRDLLYTVFALGAFYGSVVWC